MGFPLLPRRPPAIHLRIVYYIILTLYYTIPENMGEVAFSSRFSFSSSCHGGQLGLEGLGS